MGHTLPAVSEAYSLIRSLSAGARARRTCSGAFRVIFSCALSYFSRCTIFFGLVIFVLLSSCPARQPRASTCGRLLFLLHRALCALTLVRFALFTVCAAIFLSCEHFFFVASASHSRYRRFALRDSQTPARPFFVLLSARALHTHSDAFRAVMRVRVCFLV